MASLPTVLLRHATRQNTHFDWLLANPLDPNGKLWTLRCESPSDQWASLQTWLLEPIVNHRRAYLTYQGPISGDRGEVQRMDQGTFSSALWTPHRRIIDVVFNHFNAQIELNRISAKYWRAVTGSPCLI